MNNSFQKLTEAAQNIADTHSTNSKISIGAEYFRSLEDDKDLNLAAQFLAERAFSDLSGKRATIGSRTYSTCAAEFCKIDYEKVFKPSKTALGSSSEAIEKLMQNIEAAREKRNPQQLSLAAVETIYEDIAAVSSRKDKQDILREVWTKMTPVEIKYFIRIMSRGSLRIGFESKSVVSGLAQAFNKNVETVRYAHMITGSIGHTAVLCKTDRLDEASFNLFHPLSFMLASPIKSRSVENLEHYVAEEKLDGLRAQVHVSGTKVKLYSGDLDNITHSFPDIMHFLAKRSLPDVVLDGELCVFRDNQLLPIQLLQKRLNSNESDSKVAEQFPVIYISYDLLYGDDRALLKEPFTQRRKMLEELCRTHQLPIINQFPVKNRNHVQQLHDRAIAHGSKGLIFKKKNSKYECGQHSSIWLKTQKPAGTLNTVLMYVHTDSRNYHSDFTFGINVKEDERYEEEFIPIGKVIDAEIGGEIRQLHKQIEELTAEKYGPTLGLIPEIVVELEFDDIQVNKRTKANYALRLPRFKAIRWDLDPKDTNTLKDVERMYKEKINRERLKQAEHPSFHLNNKM